MATAALVVTLLAGGWLYYRLSVANRLNDKDNVVLADFDNSTGDPIFDDTLKIALSLSLRQSPFLNFISQNQIAATLQMMTRPAGAELTPETAREVCQRAHSKAYIAGAIGSLGTEYVLGLKAVNCQKGDTLAEEQVTAPSKEKVLDALSALASKLRGNLGESLSTVQRFDVPLAQATTPSLDALKAYSLSLKAVHEKGPAEAIPFDLRAIQLDPDFAVAYLSLGDNYAAVGQLERANEYFTKAFQLREHANEREKLSIVGDYFTNVTGELDKSAQAYQEQVEEYPNEPAGYSNLGVTYAEQGQYEKAAEITQRGMRVLPHAEAWYGNLSAFNLALQRFDDERQVVQEAQALKLDSFTLYTDLYALAFLRSDPVALTDQQKWFASQPAYASIGLVLASDTAAYPGKLANARDLTKQALDAAVRVDDKEGGPVLQAIAAQREAIFGNADQARLRAAAALKLAPASQGTEIEATLALALAGTQSRRKALPGI